MDHIINRIKLEKKSSTGRICQVRHRTYILFWWMGGQYLDTIHVYDIPHDNAYISDVTLPNRQANLACSISSKTVIYW